MPQCTVYIREEDLPKWKELGERKEKAARVSFAISLEQFEIDQIIELRKQRSRAVKLAASHD